MKKAFLIMASAMAFMSMVAAPGAAKKNAPKTPVSRTDLATQTEMLMSALSSDGFGLDAEEYELLMGQDLDMLDDLAGSITMPSCASEMPSLNSARPTGPVNPPIGPGPKVHVNGCSGSGDFSGDSSIEDMIKGTARPDVVPSLNSLRPTDPVRPPIGPGPGVRINGCSGSGDFSGDSSFEDMIKGNVRPNSQPSLNGGRPTKPIGPGPIDF